MSKKRKPKNGYVYLAKSTLQDGYYKYGCTTLTPDKRCKKINSENKGFNFTVIASFKSSDIFTDENKIKWNILPNSFGAMGEFMQINFNVPDFEELPTEESLIDKFLSLEF
jgi:hypothetical protein